LLVPGNYYKIFKGQTQSHALGERHANNTSAIIANGIMNTDNKGRKNVYNSENINDNIIKESANAKGRAELIAVAFPLK